ncbi:hypothetical protein [Microbispora sp. CA-102843]|uniref:hypothetical protein n=1 Tax=Microbispora sp. CA-102843 TaxID=3239952 RepID=UPI003D8F7DA2
MFAVGLAVVIAMLAGAAVMEGSAPALTLLGVAAGIPVFLLAAPDRLVALTLAVAALSVPEAWPTLASPGGVDISLGDALAVLAATTALLRRKAPLSHRLVVAVVLFLVAGVVNSDWDGALAFLRMAGPLAFGVVLGLFARPGLDLWRDVRWLCVLLIATAPLISDPAARWAGFPGGPNEVGLVAAVLTVLGAAERRRPVKLVLVAVGLAGLAGSKGIVSTIAMIAGLAMLGRLSPAGWMARTRMSRVHPLLLVVSALVAVAVIPVVRPDLPVTLSVHAAQAGVFGSVVDQGDPLFGAGWANVDPAAFAGTPLRELHNVYLDVAAYLGLLGLVLLGLILLPVVRRADPLTRAVLCTVVVWFNTTGAFPGPGWGMLGLVLAATIAHERAADPAVRGVRAPAPAVAAGDQRLSGIR